MGGIGHAVSKVVKAVTKPITSILGGGDDEQVTYVAQEPVATAAPAAPAGASPSEVSLQTNSTKKKRRGKRSLMVSRNNNSSGGGGGTGLNI